MESQNEISRSTITYLADKAVPSHLTVDIMSNGSLFTNFNQTLATPTSDAMRDFLYVLIGLGVFVCLGIVSVAVSLF